MKLNNVLQLTLWALGGFLIVAKDFEGPDIPSEELRERMYLRRRRMVTNAVLLLRRLLRLSKHPNSRENGDVEEGQDFEKEDTASFDTSGAGENVVLDQKIITGTTIITLTPDICLPTAPYSTVESLQQPTDHQSEHLAEHRHHHDLLSHSRRFLKQLLKPCTVVIALSFVISLVDPLKALFIPPSSNFQPHFRPVAPDGQPPLAVILDMATLVGDACVPLGLICLGSALAGLSLRSGEPFPKGAIASLALGKMVLIPIIGVAITRGFTHVGFVNRDDKVLQFVCLWVFFSISLRATGTPFIV
jgi:predicted permease